MPVPERAISKKRSPTASATRHYEDKKTTVGFGVFSNVIKLLVPNSKFGREDRKDVHTKPRKNSFSGPVFFNTSC